MGLVGLEFCEITSTGRAHFGQSVMDDQVAGKEMQTAGYFTWLNVTNLLFFVID